MLTTKKHKFLSAPLISPPLEAAFRPWVLEARAYRKKVEASGQGTVLLLGLEGPGGRLHVHRTTILESEGVEGYGWYLERLAKFLLWQVGGSRLLVAGSEAAAELLKAVFRPGGERAFDVELMGNVYGQPFRVEEAGLDDVAAGGAEPVALGGHLEGCRLGFDLGASDFKLAAVRDGELVYSTEIRWDPRVEPDPEYHYRQLNEGLKQAAAHLPRVDAIGGSTAGIVLENEFRVSSLFRAVPETLFQKQVRGIFHRLREEWGVPVEVANDGEVTALAGGLSMGLTGILGLAMGSSLAAGYYDAQGRITGWLNELAFAPIDVQANGPVDEWSGDRGCGVQYFSQQGVVRLAQVAGIKLAPGHPADQLIEVQERLAGGDPAARRVFETIGTCLGYALAQYHEFYGFKSVLLLGRVTSGAGGELIVSGARAVLEKEFPDLFRECELRLPDEESKRVGQAVAAASLPTLESALKEVAR
ncbi:MAG: ROK family protein [Puniceicoccaceae bacterium]|nr:MAG: ROK family protein [Puniceicoccaceae bacterium]